MHVIDVNTSFGKRVDRDPRYALSALSRELDRHRVACALSYSQKGVEYDPRAGNNETFHAAEQDSRILPVATIDPRDYPGWQVELERCVKRGARALRLFPGAQEWSARSASFRRVLEATKRARLPLMVSTMDCPTGWELSEEITRAAAGLELPLILMDTNYQNMAETISVMRQYPQVFAETHRLASVRAIEVMVRHTGAERLLYGSAAPSHPMQKALNQVLEADISDSEKERILQGNAARIFSIDEGQLSGMPELESLQPAIFTEEIIDVHSHLGYWRFPIPDEDYDPKPMIQRMARFGIAVSVLSSYESMRYDIEEGNRAISAAIAGHPELLGYVELDPNDLALSCREMDRYYRMGGFAGCELELTHISCPTASSKVRRLMAEVARRGRPVLFKPASEYDAQIERSLALENPKLAIIHAHGFDAAWAHVVRDAPNVCVEFNQSRPSHHDVRDCLDVLGAERVLFGSDQTLLSLGAAVGLYLDAGMDADERRLVLSGNARRLFSLSA